MYGYVCGVSIAVVQFANMNFSLQLDSNAADRPFVMLSDGTEMRFNRGSFTVATEIKVLRGRETSERSFLQEANYTINFSCFLGEKVGLISSDKNITFVSLTRVFSEITHFFPSKIRRLATSEGRGDGKPHRFTILSFFCTDDVAFIS